MRFRDSVQLVTKAAPHEPVGDPIPAHVGSPTSSEGYSDGIGRFTTAEAVVLLEPGGPFDPDEHVIQWRGEVWYLDGRPAYVRRHGRDHHTTVPVTRTAAG